MVGFLIGHIIGNMIIRMVSMILKATWWILSLLIHYVIIPICGLVTRQTLLTQQFIGKYIAKIFQTIYRIIDNHIAYNFNKSMGVNGR